MPTSGLAGVTADLRISALRAEATKAANSGQFTVAEEKMNAAIKECAALQPDQWQVKTDVLHELGLLYSKENKNEKAESIFKLRVDILEAHQKLSHTPILDLGIAYFDLQSIYEAAFRDAEAEEYMQKARSFYTNCKKVLPARSAWCDSHLADVEGLHGSHLFNEKRFDEALLFLEPVAARPDSQVRPEVLLAALLANAQILVNRGEMTKAQPLIDRARRIKAANPGLFPK